MKEEMMDDAQSAPGAFLLHSERQAGDVVRVDGVYMTREWTGAMTGRMLRALFEHPAARDVLRRYNASISYNGGKWFIGMDGDLQRYRALMLELWKTPPLRYDVFDAVGVRVIELDA